MNLEEFGEDRLLKVLLDKKIFRCIKL